MSVILTEELKKSNYSEHTRFAMKFQNYQQRIFEYLLNIIFE